MTMLSSEGRMTSGPHKLDCCRKESSHKIDNCNSGIILHTFIYECSAACHVHFSVGSLHEYRAQLYYDRGGWLKIHVEYSFMYLGIMSTTIIRHAHMESVNLFKRPFVNKLIKMSLYVFVYVLYLALTIGFNPLP